LQHLTPSQTFITSKKNNHDSEEKMLQKVCMHDNWNPWPLHSRCSCYQ